MPQTKVPADKRAFKKIYAPKSFHPPPLRFFLVPGTGTKNSKKCCVKTLDSAHYVIKYRVHIFASRLYSSNRILSGMCPKQWCGYVSVHSELHSTTFLGNQV